MFTTLPPRDALSRTLRDEFENRNSCSSCRAINAFHRSLMFDANACLPTQRRSLTIRAGWWFGGNMNAFSIRSGRLAGVIATIVVGAWPATGWSYTMEQQQACMGDAFRLCSSEIPDISRTTACMVRRQTELSAGCRVYFHSQETSARPRHHRIRMHTAYDD